MDAARELAQLADRELELVDGVGEHLVELGRRRRPPSRFCAARSSSASATSRCWAPSWMSRSIRRRCSSPAATIRARDSWTCASCARSSASRRAFSSASRAAAPAASSSSRLVAQARIVDDRGERLAVVLELRDRPARAVGRQRDRMAVRVGIGVALRQPERDLERRVADRLGECRPELVRGHAIQVRIRSPTCATASLEDSSPARSATGSAIWPITCHQ